MVNKAKKIKKVMFKKLKIHYKNYRIPKSQNRIDKPHQIELDP